MSEQKEVSGTEKTHLCEKCGSVMHKRVLPVQDSLTLDFINILQCNACRWYIEYSPEPQIVEPEVIIPISNELIINKAYELGLKYEKEYAGCAQTIVAAMFEALGIWSDDIFRAASGLANGLGLTRNGTCAALLGASMVISYVFGREHKDFNELYKPWKSYGLVKRLHNIFLREYGTCRCNDVQKGLIGLTWSYKELIEIEENLKNQMIDTCSKLVGNIAKIATKIILEHGYTPENA